MVLSRYITAEIARPLFLGVGLLVVVVLLVGGSYVRKSRSAAEAEASFQFYQGQNMLAQGDYDLAGFAVGIVEKDRIIQPDLVQHGDVLLGLASDGVHSNGYSLVRKLAIKPDTAFYDWLEFELAQRFDFVGHGVQQAPDRHPVQPAHALPGPFRGQQGIVDLALRALAKVVERLASAGIERLEYVTGRFQPLAGDE